MGEIRVGTCGWSYPSGPGTWNGIFYPAAAERPRRFDELSYYAEHFSTVEVNVTFYRPPVAATARRWVGRTPADFDFSLKLHQRFTHPAMFGRSAAPSSPGPAAPEDSIPEYSADDVDEFKRGIDPIASAGKLGAMLVQFPPSFRSGTATRSYLERLLGSFAGFPLAVELRHRTWSDAYVETLSLLRSFDAALVQIDEPKFRFSIRQNLTPNASGIYYVRLHGRNAANWWRHERSDDRYDYLYSAAELAPFSETARAARGVVKKAYLYLNNHFAAKAVANATELKHALGQPVSGEYRQAMLDRYPEMKSILPRASQPAESLFPET